MIAYNELKKGVRILINGQPYEILESAPMFKGRGHSVLQTKIKNLISGEALSRTFRPSDSFEAPEIAKVNLKFLFSHRNKYVFTHQDNSSKRIELEKEKIGKIAGLLKANQTVEGLMFQQKLVNISLPIKIVLKVNEAAPAIKGQSAQAGTKPVTLETGAKVNTPLFIEAGDLIEINTATGEYVRRIN